jgi:cellobiose phosphorylase
MPDSNMLQIIRGIAQAAANANAMHGSSYKGRVLEPDVGLKRDEEIPITDKRVRDGFNVKFGDDKIRIVYQSDIELRELYDSGKYEDEMEYKAVTGNTLTLTPEGEIDILAQSTTNVRSFVNVVKYYKIGGVDSTAEEERTIDAKFQKFLDQGGWTKASGDGND